jgi:drug/metabolite transporter (DMT)-like permease
MWFGLALLSALFQVLRNMSMKHLGRSLDDTINVWGRFTFLLPFVTGFVLWQGIPPLRPGFWPYVVLFGVA